jgi:hypothetical protein
MENEYSVCYKKSETISLDKYLHTIKKESDKLKLNKNGDVTYKGKVIINEEGNPINNNSYSYLEIKIYLVASGAVPKEGCDETDTINNGIFGLGCYIYESDE